MPVSSHLVHAFARGLLNLREGHECWHGCGYMANTFMDFGTGVPGDEEGDRRLAVALYRGVLSALPASAKSWFERLNNRSLESAIEVSFCCLHLSAAVYDIFALQRPCNRLG